MTKYKKFRLHPAIFTFMGAGLYVLFFIVLATPARSEDAGSTSNGPSDSTGTATLMWYSPTTNVDGTPLTDLAGYKIYYDPVSHGYREKGPKIVVPLGDSKLSCKKINTDKDGKPDKTECTYIVRDLGKGTYHFAVKAYNKAGAESDFSNEVKK